MNEAMYKTDKVTELIDWLRKEWFRIAEDNGFGIDTDATDISDLNTDLRFEDEDGRIIEVSFGYFDSIPDEGDTNDGDLGLDDNDFCPDWDMDGGYIWTSIRFMPDMKTAAIDVNDLRFAIDGFNFGNYDSGVILRAFEFAKTRDFRNIDNMAHDNNHSLKEDGLR